MSITIKGQTKLGDGDRYYEHDGERFPSVTTVLKYTVPKPALNKWMAKLVATTAYNNIEDIRALDEDAAIKYLLDLAESGKDDKAAVGTEVHAHAEAIAYGKATPQASEKALPYLVQFDKFLYDAKPEFNAVELTVYNRTLGYAGTADIFATINGKGVVIDIKTGRSVWPEVALQLCAYSRAEFSVVDGREQDVPPVKGGYVLHLSPTGYELRRVDIGDSAFAAFNAALEMYTWLNNDSKFAVGGLIAGSEND